MPTISVTSMADAIADYFMQDYTHGLGGSANFLMSNGDPGVSLDAHYAHPGFIGVFYRGTRVVLLDETMPLDLAVRLVIAALEYQSDDENGELDARSRVRT